MDDRDAFRLRSLVPLFYLLILFYALSAIILVPFGLPVLRRGEGEVLLVALAFFSLCFAGLCFLHSGRAERMTPSVRKAALFSASVTLLSFASYIATTAFFSIKPAIPIINPHNYDQVLAQFEAWLFGGTLPSLWLIERVNGWQLTALDASYNLFMPGLAFFLMGTVYLKGLKGGVRLSIAQFIGLYLCLLVTMMFPTEGPMFLYPDQFLPKLAAVPSGQMAHFLLSGITDYVRNPYNVSLVAGLAAMPSYHVFSWACGLMYWRSMPRAVLAIAVLACAADWLCTVALGWHYALDGLVSLLLVVPVWKITDAFIALALRMPLPAPERAGSEALPAPAALSSLQTEPAPPFPER